MGSLEEDNEPEGVHLPVVLELVERRARKWTVVVGNTYAQGMTVNFRLKRAKTQKRTRVSNYNIELPRRLLNFSDGRLVIGLVAGGELDRVHVGVLGGEIFKRLSCRVACASKDDRVGARCESRGETITDTTVGAGHLTVMN